ncbi:MAG: complex I NDUFA9 subunit family protein [Caulobacteraceae bacterium]
MQGLVTVFGGSGFIGRSVVRALAKHGYRVRVAVRRPGGAYQMRLMGAVGQIDVAQANIRVPSSVDRALEGAEGCVNLVGVLYESGRQGFESLHAQGAETVANAAARAGVTRLVQMSALGADAESASKYARTKSVGEQAARAAIPGAVVLRPSVVFGQDDDFFNRFASMASIVPVLPLPGGGHTRYQPVFVGDVAQAVAAAIAGKARAGETYELGGPRAYSFRELMQFVLDTTHRKGLLVPLPFPVAQAIGVAGDIQAKVLPIPPVLTSDQVELLRSDNICGGQHPGLAELGITPQAIEAIVPSYLFRYRRGGQFAEAAEAS